MTSEAERPQGWTDLAAPRVATVALVALLGMVLSACGGASPEPARTETAGLVPAAEGRTTYPLRVDTAWGDVTLDERPGRIAAADATDFGLLVALGVSPVASHDVDLDQVPWSADVLAEQPQTWEWGGDLPVPPEVMARAGTDLVVATGWGPTPFENLDQVQSVAPVLSQPDADVADPSWREQIMLLGEVLDLEDRAAGVVREHDERVADVRAKHPELAGRTIAFLEFWSPDEVYYSNVPGGTLQAMFESVGLESDPQADDLPSDLRISGELIGQVSADVVVVMDYLGDQETLDDFLDSPLFRQVDAVRQDHLLVLRSADRVSLEHDGAEIARVGLPMAYDDPIGTPKLLALLAPLLVQVLGRG